MRKIILLFLFTSFVFSQSKTSALEDKIYNSVDAFVANPTVESLQNLEVLEKTFSPKSKSEWLAFVILKCNKAYYENQFGYTNKAISNYEKAWQLFQKKQLSNYDITESCLQPLGNLYTIIGDYENAENTIKQYFYIANVTNNQQQKYSAILNLSNVYQNTGKVNEAIDLLEKTLATEKLTNAQKGVLYTNLGNNFFLSNESVFSKRDAYTKGEAAYQKAIALLKSEKNQAETLSTAYRNLAKRYAVTQEYDLANSNMEKAKAAFGLIPNLEPRKKSAILF